jgi:hypothetical protein
MQSTAKPPASRILSAANVRVSHDRTPQGMQPEETCTAPPRIETRQRNGAISEIIVTCACGQRTVIECDYGDASATRTART